MVVTPRFSPFTFLAGCTSEGFKQPELEIVIFVLKSKVVDFN